MVEGVIHNDGDGDEFDIANALQRVDEAFDDKSQLILNLSFSGYYDGDVAPPLIAFWIRELVGQGAVVVAAAGNDGACRPKFPAAMPEVLAVGSLGPCGPSPFSNHGPWVDASAPGEDLVSEFFDHFDGAYEAVVADSVPDIDDFSGWAMWSGTSFATPTVVGALAEIVEACRLPRSGRRRQAAAPAGSVPHARLRHRRQSGLLRISVFAYQHPVTALMRCVTMTEAPAPAPRLHSARMDVGELLRRVIEGDQRAWDELVGRFGGLVWSIARGYRLGALTDDVVQTVWLRLAENCERIRDPERLAAWLATTTRNEALRVSTKQAKTLTVSDLPERADAGASSLDEIVTDDDTLRHVLHGFAQLPAKDQELLRLLCTVPPLDYATIGEMLGRPIGSIGPSRERALAKLKKLLPPGLEDRHGRPTRKDDAE